MLCEGATWTQAESPLGLFAFRVTEEQPLLLHVMACPAIQRLARSEHLPFVLTVKAPL